MGQVSLGDINHGQAWSRSAELCTLWHCGHRGAPWRCSGRPGVRKKETARAGKRPAGTHQSHTGHSYVTNRNHYQQPLGIYSVIQSQPTDLTACHISGRKQHVNAWSLNHWHFCSGQTLVIHGYPLSIAFTGQYVEPYSGPKLSVGPWWSSSKCGYVHYRQTQIGLEKRQLTYLGPPFL